MKKKIFIIFLFCVFPILTLAANYQLLEPLGGGQTTITDPVQYIRQIYFYILGLTIALSVLMMVFGGVEYTLVWANESKKSEAKNRITNAITGLILGLSSYLILYTINPRLVSLEFESAGICDSGGGVGQSQSTITSGNATGSGN